MQDGEALCGLCVTFLGFVAPTRPEQRLLIVIPATIVTIDQETPRFARISWLELELLSA